MVINERHHYIMHLARRGASVRAMNADGDNRAANELYTMGFVGFTAEADRHARLTLLKELPGDDIDEVVSRREAAVREEIAKRNRAVFWRYMARRQTLTRAKHYSSAAVF